MVHRGVVVWACVAALSAVGCADRSGDVPPPETDRSSVDPDACRRALGILGRRAGEQPDAPAIAESLGVSVDDAELFLGAQDAIGRLQGRLLRDGPASFQGFAIVYEPNYLIEAWSTTGDREELLAEIEGSLEEPLAECTVVVAVPFSERELGNVLDRVHEVVTEIPFDASLDIRAGRIEIGTADEAAAGDLRALLEANEDTIGFPLERIVVEGAGVAQPA